MLKKIILFILPLWCTFQALLFSAEPLLSKEGNGAFDFNLMDLDNQQVSLSSFKGKPVILFFWTTWCPYCREELTSLSAKYDDMVKDDLGLLAINVGESQSRVASYIKRYPVKLKVVLDQDRKVAESYDLLGVPTYVFIDRQGRITSRTHYFSPGKYKDLISVQ